MSENKAITTYVSRLTCQCLGTNDNYISSTIIRYIENNSSKQRLIDQLSKVLDPLKAGRLVSAVYDMLSDKGLIESTTDGANIANDYNILTQNTDGSLSQEKIKHMMKNAQQTLEQRKKNIEDLVLSNELKAPLLVADQNIRSVRTVDSGAANPNISDYNSKIQKLSNLQSTIAQKMSNLAANSTDPSVEGPKPLLLDEFGRTVDISGQQIHIQRPTPTLKANIRAQKRAELQEISTAVTATCGAQQKRAGEGRHTEAARAEDRFYDPRLSTTASTSKSTLSGKRKMFNFHEPGKFQQLAARMRTKAQLEKLQNEISSIARRTGISSAMRMALMAPQLGLDTHTAVPHMEWWDRVILCDDVTEYDAWKPGDRTLLRGVTNLVEHPTQLQAPIKEKPTLLPLILTKSERKKLRRVNRRETLKDQQEKIRLGLEAPPEPKMKMSNLMRVLGNEAIQEPTKAEAAVRSQMAKRQKQHQDMNVSRQLTEQQAREKRIRKLQENTSEQVHVCVYRIIDLSNPSKKFKVETNARQLYMTGTVVLFRDVNVVVVEGGPKQQRKYKHLMLSRIKWDEELVTTTSGAQIDNKCTLVWEGTTSQRAFGEIRFKSCPNESFAREHFRKLNVEHYWNLAYSGALLEQDQ